VETVATKRRQEVAGTVRIGPEVFFESRTAAPAEARATSTQSVPPPSLKLLFRHATSTQLV
jgi:hypothetical protein